MLQLNCYFTCRLSGHQLSTLMNLRVSSLYHTFTTFTQWVVEGRYDFHRLPYALKTHLNAEDVEQLMKIPSCYKKGMTISVESMIVQWTSYRTFGSNPNLKVYQGGSGLSNLPVGPPNVVCSFCICQLSYSRQTLLCRVAQCTVCAILEPMSRKDAGRGLCIFFTFISSLPCILFCMVSLYPFTFSRFLFS